MLYFIGAVIISFLSGVFSVVFVALYFLYKYRDDLFHRDRKPHVEYEKNQLGSLLRHNLHNGRGISTLGEKESCCFVNVLFAFIFREWRDTNQLQKWILKKINIEFLEFMETKTASRLLNGLKIHDVSLGKNFPVFHSAEIKEPFSFTDDELPDTIVLELDMEYLGGFFLAIDVDLVFGKTAFLSVRIAYVKGRIRLHFGRQPCTHWSLCFVEEPEIKFDVETSFETRQLPQLTSLIVNQIRRTIKRKHTFPQYKMRYNPFFSFQHPEPSPFDGYIGEIPIQPATLEVCVASTTRLLISPKGEKERNSDSPNYVVFATLSVNADSCVGRSIMNFISSQNTIGKGGSETGIQSIDTPSTSKSVQSNSSKGQPTAFDSLQRSLFGAKKDVRAENIKKSIPASSQLSKTEESRNADKDSEEQKVVRSDSISSSGSSSTSGPSYIMVALNFSATLREESRSDAQKAVVVENITEYNMQGQSGMKKGDTIVELNGVSITSLSQAIATIENIRAKKEPFKFKVRRNKQDPDSTSLNGNMNAVATDSDKSSASFDTESDHSDIESVDYQDFVNISLQVAELHMKEGEANRRTRSKSSHNQSSSSKEVTRPHSSSLTSTDANSSDAPYMTLVSSPTRAASAQSLKDVCAGGNEDLPPKLKGDKVSVKERINKVVSAKSRSDSPPFFQRTSPKKLAPQKGQSSSAKGESVKKELPTKRSSSPTPSLLDTLFPEFHDSSKTRGAKHSAEKGSPSKTVVNLSYARVDDDPESQLYKTSFVNSNQREYSWNSEKFTFNLKENHRFLNIRFWIQQVGKQGIIKTKPPQVIACVSVPLCEIEMHCRGITSRRVTRRFPLFAPNELPQENKWFLNDPVSQRTSFREQYCYGDTALTLKLLPNQGNKNNSSNQVNSLDSAGIYIPDEDGNGVVTKEILCNLSQKTGRDYLLSSTAPKGQKLLVSRQTQTGERRVATTAKNMCEKEDEETIDQAIGPVSDTTENLKVQEKVSLTQMLKGLLQKPQKVQNSEEEEPSTSDEIGVERESKADDVIVGVFTNHKTGLHQFELVKFSKATRCSHCNSKLWMKTGLQCSICYVICHKRCVEKFKHGHSCPGTDPLTESDKANEENDIPTTSPDTLTVIDVTEANGSSSNSDSDGLPMAALSLRNRILDLTSAKDEEDSDASTEISKQKKYLLSKHSEDLLAVNAKEMGRDLHRDLPLSERKQMLESQTQKVENELHSEIGEKDNLLQEQKLHSSTTAQYRKFEKKILKSDERLQALTLLLLHYRAGLEDCDFEVTEEGILSDDEDEKYGAIGSKTVASDFRETEAKD